MSQVTFNQLLDDVPLYTPVEVSGFLCDDTVKQQTSSFTPAGYTPAPFKTTRVSGTLKPSLYCGSDGCNNYTYFEILTTSEQHLILANTAIHRLAYRCCN